MDSNEGFNIPVSTTSNIDGFFRARGAIIADEGVTRVEVKPPSVGRVRGVNHIRAHAPKLVPVGGVKLRVGGTSTHAQEITVHRTPTTANPARTHTTQKSATLMRQYVKPPEPSLRKQASAQAALAHAVPKLIVPKKLASSVSDTRLEQAKAITQSPLIAHHSAPKSGLLRTELAPLAVKVAPLSADTPNVPPVVPAPTPTPGEPSVPPVAPSPAPTNKPLDDIFNHALANAESFVDLAKHRAQYKGKVRRHFIGATAGALAVVVVAAFALYQTVPSVHFKVAAVRAGVSSSLPALANTGFTYQGVHTSGNKLVVGLTKAGSTYQVTQQATNLTSPEMIASVSPAHNDGVLGYSTIKIDSTNVYQFNSSSATWVKDGRWYTVTGPELSTSQLTALVEHL